MHEPYPPPDAPFAGPAVAMIELAAVPPGLHALDALVKEARVEILSAGTVQCGRYLILFGGEVEPVERALSRAEVAAGGAIVDRVLLAYAEPRIVPALRGGGARVPDEGDTLGVMQTPATPSLLVALDVALKGALVELVELRVADGLGGQGVASIWGESYDVEAAIELAEGAVARHRIASREGMWTTIIRNADPEVGRALGSTTRFFKEWRG